MNIKDSNIYTQVIKEHNSVLGDLYFFKNLVVAQINEGVHVSIENAQSCYNAIYDFYGSVKDFGLISNRINTYSIEALDYPKQNILFPNLIHYTVIGYTQFDKMNIIIEKQFCKVPYVGFKNLIEAFNYTNSFIITKSKKLSKPV